MIKIVGVRFRNAGKVYYFDPKEYSLRVGDHVIVETSRGPEYGVITTGCKMVADDQVAQPLREVIRIASDEDEALLSDIRVKEKEALKVCREKVREHELDMKVVGAEYAFDGTKMLFYFTADGRVDFRELVKDLAGVFHMRIELRQIGVRDETRMLGGIGTCGRELCCATYLREFQPVSIKMAKEQNLSLNPAKISGTCGRLMCCLKNEEETYEFLNAKMPKMGAEAITPDGQTGKVVELDVLRQRVRVLFEDEDSKELAYFPVGDLTFQPRKKKDPSAQGQEKSKGKKGEKSGQKEDLSFEEDGLEEEIFDKPERSDRTEKPERFERPERSEKTEKPEKKEHSDKSKKESASEGGSSRDNSSEENKPSERKKKSRKRRHKTEGSAPAASSASEKPAGETAAEEKSGKSAGKKRRRHRSHRPSGEQRDGAGNRPDHVKETPKHNSEK